MFWNSLDALTPSVPNKKVILLIDEYDTPILQAFNNNFYNTNYTNKNDYELLITNFFYEEDYTNYFLYLVNYILISHIKELLVNKYNNKNINFQIK